MREYLYPFEVIKVGDRAFRKSFLFHLIENAVCCSCNKNLLSCECPSNEEESKKVSEASRQIFKMRRDFWEGYNKDFRDDQAIIDYAKSVIKYHEEKRGNYNND